MATEYLHKYGSVIWITGLSGAGKSTIASEISLILKDKHCYPVVLDGDQVRDAIRDQNCGHDLHSRLENAYRISRLSQLIASQGHVVIVATMSLFHEIQAWNKDNLPNYFEVFLEVDLHVLKQRDPKKLYEKIELGDTQNMPGIDIRPEFPLMPNLKIKNNGAENEVGSIARSIVSEIQKSGQLINC